MIAESASVLLLKNVRFLIIVEVDWPPECSCGKQVSLLQLLLLLSIKHKILIEVVIGYGVVPRHEFPEDHDKL